MSIWPSSLVQNFTNSQAASGYGVPLPIAKPLGQEDEKPGLLPSLLGIGAASQLKGSVS